MHAFTKFKFAKRVFLLLSEKIGISYKVKKSHREPAGVNLRPDVTILYIPYAGIIQVRSTGPIRTRYPSQPGLPQHPFVLLISSKSLS